MFNCKICNKSLKSMRAFASHITIHNINLIDYFVKYEGFLKPKCIICGNDAKYKSGLFFRKTCGSKECTSKLFKQRKCSKTTKNIIRKKRLEFMKNHPNETAWRKRNEMSWPEKIFHDAIIRNNLLMLFEIEREKSFFPYYVDFAFNNVKVAVEIQGSQHYSSIERINKDKKKKNIILNNGWRIYYVDANQITINPDKCIEELINFIGDVKIIVKTSKIKTSSEIRKEKEEEIKEKNKLKETNQEKIFIESYNSIENKYGKIQKLAKLLNISHTAVKRRMNKYGLLD